MQIDRCQTPPLDCQTAVNQSPPPPPMPRRRQISLRPLPLDDDVPLFPSNLRPSLTDGSTQICNISTNARQNAMKSTYPIKIRHMSKILKPRRSVPYQGKANGIDSETAGVILPPPPIYDSSLSRPVVSPNPTTFMIVKPTPRRMMG